jgi:hypothetical protein
VVDGSAERFASLVESNRAAHADASFRFAHDRAARAPLVDVTDHFLEKVFDRHEACRSAMLIHDDGHLRPEAPHRGEYLVEVRRTGNIRQRPRISGGNRLVRDEVPEDLLDVQAADDVVEVAAVDRVACMWLRTNDRSELVGFGADRNARQ